MTTPANTISRGGARYYQTDIGELLSVTSIIRRGLATPAALERWKQKRIAQLVIDALAEGHDNDTAIDIALRRQYDSGPEALEGTAVHDMLDRYSQTGQRPDDRRMHEYLIQWERLVGEHDITTKATEVTLVNTARRYAGTADLICTVGHDLQRPYIRGGDNIVADFKTGKVHESGAIQLALLSRCDAILLADQRVVPIPEERRLSGMHGLIIKLGPRSGHVHKVDLRAAWKIAEVALDLIRWQDTTSKTVIREPMVGRDQIATLRHLDARRVTLLERARTLDVTRARETAAAWPNELPKLSEPSLGWTGDNLDLAETLIANAERGGVA